MFEPSREDDLDAVLIFEPDGTFRMERLVGQIKARYDCTDEQLKMTLALMLEKARLLISSLQSGT